ncbi:MAG: DUF4351 domain-containing protein, partial [Mariprofundales bacterium]
KNADELDNDLDRWFYFLKSASSLEAVPKSMATDAAIQHAFSIANKAGLSSEELNDQEHREIFIQDQRGALSLAKKQGLEEGMQKGEAGMLLRQMRLKFGGLTPSTIAIVQAADIAQLQAWSEQIFSATTVEALLQL